MRASAWLLVFSLFVILSYAEQGSYGQDKSEEKTKFTSDVTKIQLLGCGDFDLNDPTIAKWVLAKTDDPANPTDDDKVNDNDYSVKVKVYVANNDGFVCKKVKCKIYKIKALAENAPLVPSDGEMGYHELQKLNDTVFLGENVEGTNSDHSPVNDFNHFIVAWAYFEKDKNKTLIVRYPAKDSSLGFIVENFSCVPEDPMSDPEKPDMPPPPMMQSSQP